MPDITPLSIAKDLAKDFVLKKAKRHFTENMTEGTATLEPIETDIRKIAQSVYAYQAQYELAKSSANAPRRSTSEYLVNCLRVGTLQQSREIKALIEDLRTIGSQAGEIEERAINRARAEAEGYRKKIQDYSQTLNRYERYGPDPRMEANAAGHLRENARKLNHFENKATSTDLMGNAIQDLIADLIGVLKAIRNDLIKNGELFTYFAKDCQSWHAKWARQ